MEVQHGGDDNGLLTRWGAAAARTRKRDPHGAAVRPVADESWPMSRAGDGEEQWSLPLGLWQKLSHANFYARLGMQ